MRFCFLAVSATLLLANGLLPARAAGEAVQTQSATGHVERSGIMAQQAPTGWLWELVRDQLTIPLGQAEQPNWAVSGA